MRIVVYVLVLVLMGLPAQAYGGVKREQVAARIEQAVLHPVSGVTTLVLSNGVNVHVRPMAEKERVYITMLASGVELHETPMDRGVTQLGVESMTLPTRGPRIRANLIAEGVSFRVTCAKNELPVAIEVLGEVIAPGGVTLDADEFRRVAEREGVDRAAQTLRGGQSASQRANKQVAEAMLRLMTPSDDVRLRRPTREEFSRVTPESAKAYLDERLAVCAIDLAVVGDVRVGDVAAALERSVLKISPRTRDREGELRDVARLVPEEGSRQRIMPGPVPKGQSLISVSIPGPSISTINESRHAQVAARLLQNEVSEAFQKSGLSVRLSTGVSMSGRVYPKLGSTVGSFMIATDPDGAARATKVLNDTIAQLIDKGPTAASVKTATEDAAAEIEPRLKSADYWSQSLAVAWFLGIEIDELERAPKVIRSIDTTAMNAYLAKWWRPDRVVCVTLIPEAEPEPAEPVGNPR